MQADASRKARFSHHGTLTAGMHAQQQELEQLPELQWQSLRWPDGSWYEGLTRDGMQHRHGVMHHANGDRYEGEFSDGHMDGFGVYIWSDGMVYRGEWMRDVAHGCGVRLWQDKHAGATTSASSNQSPMPADAQSGFQVQEGKFAGDEFVGPIMSCSVEASQEAAVEADMAAHVARKLITPMGHALRRQRHRKPDLTRQQANERKTATVPEQQQASTTPQAGCSKGGLHSLQHSGTNNGVHNSLHGSMSAGRQAPSVFGWKLSWPWEGRAQQNYTQTAKHAPDKLDSAIARGAVGTAEATGLDKNVGKHDHGKSQAQQQHPYGEVSTAGAAPVQHRVKARVTAHPQHQWGLFGRASSTAGKQAIFTDDGDLLGGLGGVSSTAGNHASFTSDGDVVAASSADPVALPQLQKLPAGHPALDPDVGFRTRRLRPDEQQAVSGLVNHFMALAARQYHG